MTNFLDNFKNNRENNWEKCENVEMWNSEIVELLLQLLFNIIFTIPLFHNSTISHFHIFPSCFYGCFKVVEKIRHFFVFTGLNSLLFTPIHLDSC